MDLESLASLYNRPLRDRDPSTTWNHWHPTSTPLLSSARSSRRQSPRDPSSDFPHRYLVDSLNRVSPSTLAPQSGHLPRCLYFVDVAIAWSACTTSDDIFYSPTRSSAQKILSLDIYTVMAEEAELQPTASEQPHPIARSDSSASTSPSDSNEHVIHQPIPVRPGLPTRKSSGPLVVPRDSSAVGPLEPDFGPDDVRAMSPRRTSEDLDRMGKEARDEMRR